MTGQPAVVAGVAVPAVVVAGVAVPADLLAEAVHAHAVRLIGEDRRRRGGRRRDVGPLVELARRLRDPAYLAGNWPTAPRNSTGDRWLSCDEWAETWGMAARTARRYASGGRVPARRVGNRWEIRADAARPNDRRRAS